MADQPVLVVFGARNVGRAIIGERLAVGWKALAMVRSEETADLVRESHPTATVLRGDAADPIGVAEALAKANRDLGGIDLVVNAITAPPSGQPFGGGPVIDAPAERLDDWLAGFLPPAWHVMRLAGQALVHRGAGTIVQIAGGSARRSMPNRGPWAVAQQGARALALSLAQELRPVGVHVCVLVADGMIVTDRNPMPGAAATDALTPSDVADAVAYLHSQKPSAWTHEMTLTPVAESWTP